MGIYDKKESFDFGFAFSRDGKPSSALLLIVAGIIIVILLFVFFNFFSAKPLKYSFQNSSIKSTEQAILVVGVTNTFVSTLRDVIVEVFPEDQRAISVSQPIRKIETLDSYRELTFLVNPVGSVLPGSYVIKISVTMGGQKFTETAVLTIS